MKWILLLYLFFEVLVTISIGGEIGGLNTFLEIIVSAIIGIIIVMNFKKILMQSMMTIMSKQLDAQQILAGNVSALIGAILLIIPGFFSDIIGLLLQFSFIAKMIASRIKAPKTQTQHNYTHKGDDNVIDVEIVEHNTITK